MVVFGGLLRALHGLYLRLELLAQHCLDIFYQAECKVLVDVHGVAFELVSSLPRQRRLRRQACFEQPVKHRGLVIIGHRRCALLLACLVGDRRAEVPREVVLDHVVGYRLVHQQRERLDEEILLEVALDEECYLQPVMLLFLCVDRDPLVDIEVKLFLLVELPEDWLWGVLPLSICIPPAVDLRDGEGNHLGFLRLRVL